MAAYAEFLGKKVAVQYRVGDILLTANATFVGDCGKSIFLEQHLEQNGKKSYFRWEIPYPFIHRIEESADPEPTVAPSPAPEKSSSKNFAAAAGHFPSSSPLADLSSLTRRPKTV